jgi:hypothetical protein
LDLAASKHWLLELRLRDDWCLNEVTKCLNIIDLQDLVEVVYVSLVVDIG